MAGSFQFQLSRKADPIQATILRQIVAGPRARHPDAGLDLCYVADNSKGPKGSECWLAEGLQSSSRGHLWTKLSMAQEGVP